MELHLGVIDVPYVSADGTTTGDVAGYLEDKYHIMGTFAEHHGQQIADALANGLAGSIESMMMGAPSGPGDEDSAHEVGLLGAALDQSPFLGATSAIEHQFKEFIALGEVERSGIAGVPTEAALEGKSKRFKSGNSGGPRPSFIDSGLYYSSFKAWVEE